MEKRSKLKSKNSSELRLTLSVLVNKLFIISEHLLITIACDVF